MTFFDPHNKSRSPNHRRIYALYEVAFTAVDFAAAILFLVGSALFFDKSLEHAALWCFVVGSVFFALKPTIRVAREIHLLALGDYSDLAERAE